MEEEVDDEVFALGGCRVNGAVGWRCGSYTHTTMPMAATSQPILQPNVTPHTNPSLIFLFPVVSSASSLILTCTFWKSSTFLARSPSPIVNE